MALDTGVVLQRGNGAITIKHVLLLLPETSPKEMEAYEREHHSLSPPFDTVHMSH